MTSGAKSSIASSAVRSPMPSVFGGTYGLIASSGSISSVCRFVTDATVHPSLRKASVATRFTRPNPVVFRRLSPSSRTFIVALLSALGGLGLIDRSHVGLACADHVILAALVHAGLGARVLVGVRAALVRATTLRSLWLFDGL